MRLLHRTHEWAADKGWMQYPEPGWRRARRGGHWIDRPFRWALAYLFVWPIIAPVVVAGLIGIVILIGTAR